MKEIMLIIDGNSLLHRAYWAMPQMNDKSGRPTNAVYGFFSMLFKIIEQYSPSYIAVAFDGNKPTFRHESYTEYKAGRRKTPDDLREQFAILKDALSMIDIKDIVCEGWEADDVIGTLAKESGKENYIFTGDRDELQLISKNTTVVLTKKGVSDTKEMTEEALYEELGIKPFQIPDLKGLMGDSSDNIPGVPGIGEKTALKLLHTYKTVPELYSHIDELPKNKLQEKLINGEESAFMSLKLATIDCDAPLNENIDYFKFNGFNSEKLKEMCNKYSFKTFIKRFSLNGGDEGTDLKSTVHTQSVIIDESGLDRLKNAKEAALIVTKNDLLFAVDESASYILSFTDENKGEILSRTAELLKDVKTVAHDIKSLLHLLREYGKSLNEYFDIMLGAWIVNPSLNKYDAVSIFKRADLEYNAANAMRLYHEQLKQIEKDGLAALYFDVEIPLIKVLFDMECAGFYVEKSELESLGKKYDKEIKRLTDEIYDFAGEAFNIGSPKQLGMILFEKLELPVIKKTKTGYSTDMEVLEKLSAKHPIIADIIEYRALTKLKNTYVDGLLNAMEPDGYIHTTFLQTGTSTGRLSSTEPNLQNIPIRSPLAADIRRAFAAPEGMTIVSADYSQIELRVLASIADDESLKQAFYREEDIHARTAAEILEKDIDEVTKEERSHAKAVNFGIVYGISDFGLSKSTGLSRKEAAHYIDKYLQEFSGVKNYMDNIKAQAKEQQYVKTLMGRTRYIPDINSKNHNLQSAAERIALNTPIQGTAADIMKVAMINTVKALKATGARLVLQVHDELIVYALDDEVDKIKDILKKSMESAAELAVPLKVNIADGKTWQEAK